MAEININTDRIFDLAVRNWRSSVIGLLSGAIACITAVTALPPTAGKLVIAGALANTLIRILSQDPGKQLSNVPDTALPESVPSHEEPNDPSAKPVL